MIVRPPWSKALKLEWHRPELAHRLANSRVASLLGLHNIAHFILNSERDNDRIRIRVGFVREGGTDLDAEWHAAGCPLWFPRGAGRLRQAGRRGGGRDGATE